MKKPIRLASRPFAMLELVATEAATLSIVFSNESRVLPRTPAVALMSRWFDFRVLCFPSLHCLRKETLRNFSRSLLLVTQNILALWMKTR
jgi:hypothetical protein